MHKLSTSPPPSPVWLLEKEVWVRYFFFGLPCRTHKNNNILFQFFPRCCRVLLIQHSCNDDQVFFFPPTTSLPFFSHAMRVKRIDGLAHLLASLNRAGTPALRLEECALPASKKLSRSGGGGNGERPKTRKQHNKVYT